MQTQNVVVVGFLIEGIKIQCDGINVGKGLRLLLNADIQNFTFPLPDRYNFMTILPQTLYRDVTVPIRIFRSPEH